MIKVKDLNQKAKMRWASEGEENSHFFHGIINVAGIVLEYELNIQSEWISDRSAIKLHISDSFSKRRFKEIFCSRPYSLVLCLGTYP